MHLVSHLMLLFHFLSPLAPLVTRMFIAVSVVVWSWSLCAHFFPSYLCAFLFRSSWFWRSFFLIQSRCFLGLFNNNLGLPLIVINQVNWQIATKCSRIVEKKESERVKKGFIHCSLIWRPLSVCFKPGPMDKFTTKNNYATELTGSVERESKRNEESVWKDVADIDYSFSNSTNKIKTTFLN